MGTNNVKIPKHVSPNVANNIFLTARIGTTIKIRFLLSGVAPETARRQKQKEHRWGKPPYQPPSQRAKSISSGFTIHQLLGKVARAIAFSKLRNVVMTYDRATASVIDAMLERRLQLIQIQVQRALLLLSNKAQPRQEMQE